MPNLPFSLRAATSVLLTWAAMQPALAQTGAGAGARAANQLGLLEYCQARGFVGADAVAAQKNAIAAGPASSGDTAVAEALGREGTLAGPDGTKTPIARVAESQHGSVPELCGRMGSAAVRTAASVPQSFSGASGIALPTMPPGLPPVPGLPGGSGAVLSEPAPAR